MRDRIHISLLQAAFEGIIVSHVQVFVATESNVWKSLAFHPFSPLNPHPTPPFPHNEEMPAGPRRPMTNEPIMLPYQPLAPEFRN